MDTKIESILKIYDIDNIGYLNQATLLKLQEDIKYKFTEKEIKLYNLMSDKIPLNCITDALNYEETEYDDNQFMMELKLLDTNNDGKIFIPELINILKDIPFFTKIKLDELLINLPKDDQYYIYK
jgi:Ca2+-binding EF-hand superfamily protein